MVLVLLLPTVQTWAAEEGHPAPEFIAHLEDGSDFTTKKMHGHVIVLHFWASFCEPCKKELPLLSRYYSAHHHEGLELIAISMDRSEDFEKARAIAKKFTFPWALAKNSKFKSYGRIWRLPLTFVIDRQGTLVRDGWVLKHVMIETDLDQTLTPLLKN